MPIFFPGKSKCRLCGDTIATQLEVVVLPYIGPEHVSAFRVLPQSFVHRNCYNNWDQKKHYASLSFEFALKHRPGLITSDDCIGLYRDDREKTFIIHDFLEIFEYKLNSDTAYNDITEIRHFLNTPENPILTINNCWKLEKSAKGIFFGFFDKEVMKDQVVISLQRVSLWVKMLDAVLHTLENQNTD